MRAINIVTGVCTAGVVLWAAFYGWDYVKRTSHPSPPIQLQSDKI